MADVLAEYIAETAGGRPTKSEALGHREFYIPYKYQDTQEAFEKKCRL